MNQLHIEVSEELHRAWPGFRGAAVFATVRNTAYNAELWFYQGNACHTGHPSGL